MLDLFERNGANMTSLKCAISAPLKGMCEMVSSHIVKLGGGLNYKESAIEAGQRKGREASSWIIPSCYHQGKILGRQFTDIVGTDSFFSISN
jgi:hypothetical protein